mmetsp:Transcript_38718/g.97534  ORF Transcript_38718/g.97534 Transcript_38718/m.97534 type:complete len:320 (+) Transcript_38718:239-1198(+)|eukprot:CAMPEP_0177633728 /NCGR_PEP_ID=MMETSP0447-20121125/2993_1 /TAXON_ID=0 /ORGANISM="Stygamoeba regulata, Strain BSH-02190019" /LENGTH=319 /DNA_ID=CAMNT_0019135409 /DNA_START=162 /DNA_END=1121 /DNA_ORIENTATION=+
MLFTFFIVFAIAIVYWVVSSIILNTILSSKAAAEEPAHCKKAANEAAVQELQKERSKEQKRNFQKIVDKYKTLEEVTEALRVAGLQNSNLILGIDFTKSNEYTGRTTFHNRCLHDISDKLQNPYQRVISIIGRTLDPFDEDHCIPAFGFGDSETTDQSVFPFFKARISYGFQEVLNRYNEIVSTVTLSGPTNFAPIINKAIDIVKEKLSYHILVIIADGQVIYEHETKEAIVKASNYPLSIVLVGVGDGPWDKMKDFDDGLPKRKFDNFQFVNFHEVTASSKNPDVAFAVHALQEVPEQFKLIHKLNYLAKRTHRDSDA